MEPQIMIVPPPCFTVSMLLHLGRHSPVSASNVPFGIVAPTFTFDLISF